MKVSCHRNLMYCNYCFLLMYSMKFWDLIEVQYFFSLLLLSLYIQIIHFRVIILNRQSGVPFGAILIYCNGRRSVRVTCVMWRISFDYEFFVLNLVVPGSIGFSFLYWCCGLNRWRAEWYILTLWGPSEWCTEECKESSTACRFTAPGLTASTLNTGRAAATKTVLNHPTTWRDCHWMKLLKGYVHSLIKND